MREEIRDKGRLEHILSAIDAILKGKENTELLRLRNEPIVFYGFVKNIEIIGEATYMLTKEFKSTHTDVDWFGIERMRHVLVHGYYKISESQLWYAINNDVPKLKPWIEKYLKKFE